MKFPYAVEVNSGDDRDARWEKATMIAVVGGPVPLAVCTQGRSLFSKPLNRVRMTEREAPTPDPTADPDLLDQTGPHTATARDWQQAGDLYWRETGRLWMSAPNTVRATYVERIRKK